MGAIPMPAVITRSAARKISVVMTAVCIAFGIIVLVVVLVATPVDRDKHADGIKFKSFEGGESSIAKPPVDAQTPKPPVPPPPAASSTDMPRLEGLVDIPLEAWDSEKPKPEENKLDDVRTGEKEVLPWDDVEPVPFLPKQATAHGVATPPSKILPKTNSPSVAPTETPSSVEIESWVKARATKIKGAERARALSHFDFWFDAPDEVIQRVVAVAYEFNTPAVMPQSQLSREAKTRFRISAGGLTCPDQVSVTVRYNDGQSQKVTVDGCRLVR